MASQGNVHVDWSCESCHVCLRSASCPGAANGALAGRSTHQPPDLKIQRCNAPKVCMLGAQPKVSTKYGEKVQNVREAHPHQLGLAKLHADMVVNWMFNVRGGYASLLSKVPSQNGLYQHEVVQEPPDDPRSWYIRTSQAWHCNNCPRNWKCSPRRTNKMFFSDQTGSMDCCTKGSGQPQLG